VKLTLRPRIVFSDDHPLAQYNPFQYEVLGLPPNRIVWVGELTHRRETGRWKILPIAVGSPGMADCYWVKGKWTGDYESPGAALAAIDEQFLQDPAHWPDVD
jgi:hypothetical protein